MKRSDFWPDAPSDAEPESAGGSSLSRRAKSAGSPASKTAYGLLSRRALNVLLRGRHAVIGGRTVAQRARRLVDIASAYTAEELAAEHGIGPVTIDEIRRWLQRQGRSLNSTSDKAGSRPTRRKPSGSASQLPRRR